MTDEASGLTTGVLTGAATLVRVAATEGAEVAYLVPIIERTGLACGWGVQTVEEPMPGLAAVWDVEVSDDLDIPRARIRCTTREQADRIHGREIDRVLDGYYD